MLRSILAVLAGLVVIPVLSIAADGAVVATMPQAFGADGSSQDATALVLVQAGVAVAAVFGCWLTAFIAPNRPMRHALVLGVLGLVINMAGAAQAGRCSRRGTGSCRSRS